MKYFLMGLLFLFLWQPSFAFSATIHIKNTAEISRTHFTLGDIATISASSPQEEMALETLVIGVIPADESLLVLTASQIGEKLRPHFELLKNSQVKIPEKIEIHRKDQTISASKVKEQIEKIIQSQLPDPSWEYQVSEVSLAPVINQLKASGFQVIQPLGRPKGVFSFELIATEHSLPHRFWVTAKIQYFCKVATLTRQINAHSRFLASDVSWQRKEVTFMNDIPATSQDAAVALARMNLSPGTVLLRSHLEREMALKFGEQVDLILGEDGVAIITKGIAQQNGFVGDTVKVKSVETNKVLDGIITARGVVNVRY